MSTRLASGGRRINRAAPLEFTFNGRRMKGYRGDTLASALLAQGQLLQGRSFKYHRPRGPVAAGVEEPNALMGVNEGPRFEPNQRATTTELYDGLRAESQNHWPSLQFDVGAINARLSRFLPAGFYYKTFLAPRGFWKHVYEPVIRRSAGLGKPPQEADADRYEHSYAFVDVLVVGGGLAGLLAARAAGRAGARVLLIEQTAHWGGRAAADRVADHTIEAVDNLVDELLSELRGMSNVQMRDRCTGAGLYDHGYALALERLTDDRPGARGPRQRLWRIRAGQVICATGALERPLSFAGNDVPGVVLASALRDYISDYAVSLGDRTVIVTNNDTGYLTAFALKRAGLDVPLIVDPRPEGGGAVAASAERAGFRIARGRAIAKVHGTASVRGVDICLQAGEGAVLEHVPCDAVAMSGGWSPVVHLWSHCGGKLVWDEAEALFRPDVHNSPVNDAGEANVTCVGAANGTMTLAATAKEAADAGSAAARATGHAAEGPPAPPAALEKVPEALDGVAPIQPVWMMPQGAGQALRAKAFLDFQNDVKVSDVELAAQEGFESVEHAKRYTTLGMATDQGKLSNINGLAILSRALDAPIPEVGTTTFRPPYTPVTLGAIAGEARGRAFQPIRETPLHDWHEENGAVFEPVGQWRRPYCYPRAGEDKAAAVAREITQTRTAVGMLDASTLGKILVQGPDAGRFLDMLYTNMMSSLKPGRCRYGLMCNENGFLMDDGVVARLGPETFLCHTTTGGAEAIHGHMEEWLQTEWWDWQVHTLNLTEQFAQIAVVGPKAREVLQSLGGAVDLSPEALSFMGWTEGKLGDFDARIFRISFSGELSFEVAVPASQGRDLWQALLKAGAAHGISPYGTEALHVMRAEKGFIMIGDETDGTVTPQDLNLQWAISKKKDDYIGKAAQARPHLAAPDRWRLVGLRAEDDGVLPEGAYILDEGLNENGQRRTQGRVTSTYHSPTLGHGIAMALLRGGPERMGETVEVASRAGGPRRARVVDPVFLDPEGERQNV